MSEAQSNQLFVNGLDADSGDYLLHTDVSTLARVIRGEASDAELQAMLRGRYRNDQFAAAVREGDSTRGHLGTVAGIDSRSLAESGWGVIFPYNAPGRSRCITRIAGLAPGELPRQL